MPKSRIESRLKNGIPRSANAFAPPSIRSIMAATQITRRPNSCTRSIAKSEDPPVVTTSSTIATVVAGLDRPFNKPIRAMPLRFFPH